MSFLLFVAYIVFILITLYKNSQPIVFEIGSALYLLVATFIIGLPVPVAIVLWVIIGFVIALIHINKLRQLISDFIFSKLGPFIPKLSKTEEQALNAGDTWLEKDIFTGTLNWDKLHNTTLTKEEQDFLDNETQMLCSMIDEWQLMQYADLSENVWNYIKDNGFLGLVIDKKYGGKGFSGRAHADIVFKIASKSVASAVTVMVPNSLGPGELLQFYGTQEQKNYYLPRLAKGIDIPCFALTEPTAGSDATSIQSEGVVVKRNLDGKEILGINFSLNKRWITLSPVATLIGVAITLKDPDNLLNGEGNEGITCLLVSHDTKNLEIGNRHIPANQPFMNGTIRGEDIFVPIDAIIGGQAKAGHGWQMLVECLSIGRSISLPALGSSAAATSYISAGAFSRIRKQFRTEIRAFEGIEEKLAQLAGMSYITTATRLLTVAAVNEHKKPSVASAITKYWNTEFGRTALNHAMDIHGGRAVVSGPRNYLSGFYQGMPICITVEGANIMTRNLLIFGQGSMACHPYIRDEFYAISKNDKQAFNKLIWKHINYSMHNFAKMLCSSITAGIFIKAPKELKRQYQTLARLSYAYAFINDVALGNLGGDLKRKERLSARLGDVLSYLYMAMACLEHYAANKNEDFKLHALWACKFCFYHAEHAISSFCDNYPSKFLGKLLRLVALPFGQRMKYPDDKLDHKLAKLMSQDNAYRKSLEKSIYLSDDKNYGLNIIEKAFKMINATQDIYKKVGNISKYKLKDLNSVLVQNVKAGKITNEEMQQILEVEKIRWDAILVDEFSFDDMKKHHYQSIIDTIKTPFD